LTLAMASPVVQAVLGARATLHLGGDTAGALLRTAGIFLGPPAIIALVLVSGHDGTKRLA
jgi:hypothetical protein